MSNDLLSPCPRQTNPATPSTTRSASNSRATINSSYSTNITSKSASNRSSIRVLPSKATNAQQSTLKTLPIHRKSSPATSSTCSCSSECSCSEDSEPKTRETTPPRVLPPASSIQIISSVPPNLSLMRTLSTRHSSTNNNAPANPQDMPRRWMTSDRLNELRKRTHEAIRNHKVFLIRGCFTTVRKALLLRGFVEKLDVHRKAAMALNLTTDEMLHQLPNRQPGESRRQYISKCERNIISRFLEHTPVDFLWTFRKEKVDWIDMARNPNLTTNKFHKVPFTTKEGICSSLRDFQWFHMDGVAELNYPRCYNVFNPDELEDFVEDFRLTACISFIRYVVDTFNKRGVGALVSSTGTIPMTSIQFAIKRCREFVAFSEHLDVDSCDDRGVKIWDHDWDVFLAHHYYLTHEGGMLAEGGQVGGKSFEVYLSMAAKVLKDMEPFWPQFTTDGHLNIWIVKPANRCRGKGILLMNNIKKIIGLVNPSTITKTRFVVQKYMERPLTIYNTKFDIRQWFLVTSVQPLCIWMYRESYLRFSSQPYNLLNYHESVHLTNYAVQKKYVVDGERDERLPTENMWDSYTFQAYLRQIGKQDMWDERIFPGMQRAIIGTLLASQDNMDRRPNTFELFGADFMICENYYPWLIEINSSPDLGNTTSVTARMCPQCLEDTVKVVVDRKNDPKADTGNFECIYRQTIPPSPAYMGLNLSVKGHQIATKNNFSSSPSTSSSACPSGGVKRDQSLPRGGHLKQFVSRNISSGKGPVIMDLIDCLDVKQRKGQPPTSGVPRNWQGVLKSRNKVDVEFKEKNHRRHHSGPVLRQQQGNAIKVGVSPGRSGKGEAAAAAAVGLMEEPLIVPVQSQQVAKQQKETNLVEESGSKENNREAEFCLPPVVVGGWLRKLN